MTPEERKKIVNMSDEEKEKLSIDDCFMLALEDLAAEKEVTVDYYMEEFM